MRRFHISPEAVQGKRVIFAARDAHHIKNVLRMRRGEDIVAFDGRGNEYSATIAIISSRRVEAVIRNRKTTKNRRLYSLALAQAVLKGSALDLVIRQATEVGISDFYPLITCRSLGWLKRGLLRKIPRWEKIAIEATRQSGGDSVPRIHTLLRWEELLLLASRYQLKLLFWEGERKNLKEILRLYPSSSPPERILLLVGPEGGFSKPEVDGAVKAGFQTAGLGPGILRASTAGVVAPALIHYHFHDSARGIASGKVEI